MTFSELLSEYLDLRDVAREAETVIEPATQRMRRDKRMTELLAEMTKLVHAAGVPRLDPAPTAESFDGITGRPFGVATDQPTKEST